MNIFKKAAEKTVDAVKEVASAETATKLDVLGDLAKIGLFALTAYGMIKGSNIGASHAAKNLPDVSSLIINNYYYGDKTQHKGGKQ